MEFNWVQLEKLDTPIEMQDDGIETSLIMVSEKACLPIFSSVEGECDFG